MELHRKILIRWGRASHDSVRLILRRIVSYVAGGEHLGEHLGEHSTNYLQINIKFDQILTPYLNKHKIHAEQVQECHFLSISNQFLGISNQYQPITIDDFLQSID